MVLIVDGNNLLYKYTNIKELGKLTRNDNYVGATYGFLRSIRYYIATTSPDLCIVVWDGGRSERRMDLHPTYKISSYRKLTDREKKLVDWLASKLTLVATPDEKIINLVHKYATQDLSQRHIVKSLFDMKRRETIKTQRTSLNEILKLSGVRVITVQGKEADDVIFRAVVMYTNMKKPVTIVSDDKDFYGLVSKDVTLIRPKNKETIDISTLKSKTGLSPNEYLYYKILMGDKSDKIDGIMQAPDGAKKYAALLSKLSQDPVKGIGAACANNGNKDAPFCQKKDLAIRNAKLIDLSHEKFTGEHIASVISAISANEKDFKKLKEMFEQLGFKEMLNDFNNWIRPFTHLQ